MTEQGSFPFEAEKMRARGARAREAAEETRRLPGLSAEEWAKWLLLTGRGPGRAKKTVIAASGPRCEDCGRVLTAPESIAAGSGPVCRRRR